MSQKKSKAPAIWTNSFFWFGAAMLILGVLGLVRGDDIIRDPGQVKESNLSLYYLGGAVLMIVNGVISHLQAVKGHQESSESNSE